MTKDKAIKEFREKFISKEHDFDCACGLHGFQHDLETFIANLYDKAYAEGQKSKKEKYPMYYVRPDGTFELAKGK